MIRAESAFMLFVLTAVVAVILGHALGYGDGHRDGYQEAVDNRKPMPPATVCKAKMSSSKYKQLDCVRHVWREQ